MNEVIGTVPTTEHDVVVVGAGIAGLSAALEAAEAGARVLLLEKAPRAERGGNTRFSDAQFRYPHEADEYSPVTTTPAELYADCMRVTHQRANPALIDVLVNRAAEAVDWLTARGVRWAAGFPHTATYRRRPEGGGLGIVDALFARLEALPNVTIRYQTAARGLIQDATGAVSGVRALGPEPPQPPDLEGSQPAQPPNPAGSTGGGGGGDRFWDCHARGGVVLASGSFAASPELRVRYLGPWAENLIVRGTRYNTGEGLLMALAAGAQSAGQWGDYHSAVLDANSARIECGVTAIYIYQLGIIVNTEGRRFLDEGEDYRDNTYVKFSKIMVQQPGGLAYCVLDQQARRDPAWDRGVKTVTPPLEASTHEELAAKMGVPVATYRDTVQRYNAAVDRARPYDPDRLDGKAARGIDPPKSNWALPIEEPPYLAFAVTGGITFAFGGLKTDPAARVIDTRGQVIPGLYAAGEPQGEFYFYNYPGATGVLRGCVFGRLAARDAVARARR